MVGGGVQYVLFLEPFPAHCDIGTTRPFLLMLPELGDESHSQKTI